MADEGGPPPADPGDSGDPRDLDFPDLPRLALDQLLGQLIDRAQEVMVAQGRLRGLLRANQLITGELSLPALLRGIAEAAAELVGARYAALGVLSGEGGLSEFVHTGMPPGTVEGTVGPLPAGKGLGVPIRIRDEVFGHLYLAESTGGEFTAEDEELMLALAATAAISIENARLYEAARARGEWLQATAAITRSLLSAGGGGAGGGAEALTLIAERCRSTAGADLVTVTRPVDGDDLRIEVAVGDLAGTVADLTVSRSRSLAGQVLSSGQSLRLPDARRSELAGGLVDRVELGPLLVVPLLGSGRVHGVISVGRRPGGRTFSAEDLDMVAGFANQATVAIELAQARAEQERAAMLDDRERIAADLHDHVIQRIFAAGLNLQAVVATLAPGRAVERITSTINDLDTTISQIRTAIFRLQETPGKAVPGVRSQLLGIADEAAAALGFHPAIRFSGVMDTLPAGVLDDVSAVLREGLSNVARHARARSVEAEVVVGGGRLTLDLTDDGIGIAPGGRRSGLANLRRRAEQRAGQLAVEPATPSGTHLRWSVPLP